MHWTPIAPLVPADHLSREIWGAQLMRYLTYFLLGVTIATPASAASVDDILAAHRAACGGNAWQGKAALNLKYDYVGQGLTGTTATTFDVTNGRFVDTYDLGAVSGANGFDGAHAWAKDPSGTVTTQDGGSTLPISFNEAYRDANLWWRADRGSAVIELAPAKSNKELEAISVTPRNGERFD